MQGRQVFGAIVRGLGLYLLLDGVSAGIYAAAHVVPIPIQFKLTFANDATWCLLDFVAAAVLFWGADSIVRIAYGAAPRDPADVFN